MHAKIFGLFVFMLGAILGISTAWAADQPSGADFVNVFNKIYGVHAGYRANHAKGILAEGTFTPPKAAARRPASAPAANPPPG